MKAALVTSAANFPPARQQPLGKLHTKSSPLAHDRTRSYVRHSCVCVLIGRRTAGVTSGWLAQKKTRADHFRAGSSMPTATNAFKRCRWWVVLSSRHNGMGVCLFCSAALGSADDFQLPTVPFPPLTSSLVMVQTQCQPNNCNNLFATFQAQQEAICCDFERVNKWLLDYC